MRNVGIILVIVLLLLFVVAIVFTPTPTDWRYSYSKLDKEPHGSYLLYNELEQLFPGAEIVTSDTTVEETIKNWDKSNTLYIQVRNNLYSYFRKEYRYRSTIQRLDSFINQGNNVFIASRLNLRDSILSVTPNSTLGHIRTDYSVGNRWGDNRYRRTRPLRLNYVEPSKQKIYKTSSEYASTSIRVDSVKHIQLGTINDTLTNFIKVPRENGAFYFHANPNLFTNYAMINDSLYTYVSQALSQVGKVDYVIWDEYYKPEKLYFGRGFSGEQKSPFYLFEENRALYIVRFLTILGAFLMIFTYFKRRQQAIPIIKPPENKTVEFTKNISTIYLEKAEHMDIAQKKIEFFEFELKRNYKLTSIEKYSKKPEELAKITGFQKDDIDYYFTKRKLVEQLNDLTEEQLMQISNAIENLKKNQL